MADLANAAMAASLIVGLVSVPAASGSIQAEEPPPDPVENISSSQSVPRDSSTSMTAEGFTRTVETAFSEFSTQIDSGEVDGELETPGSRLELDREPGSVKWTLESSQGTLTLEKNSTAVVETTQTPQGVLTEYRVQGTTRTEFSGSDRQAVEKASEQLREEMKKQREDFIERSSREEVTRSTSELSLDVKPETPEKAVITNQGDSETDLSGYSLQNNNPDSIELDETLEPGQSLHVYSAAQDDEALSDLTENEDDIYVYDSDLTWEDGGDTATLLDSQGSEVESFNY